MMTYCDNPSVLRLETLNAAGAVTDSLDLMDEANGYRITSLDVGFPTVRDQTAALPTRDGDYDTTFLFGPRVVTIVGWLVPTAAGRRQQAMQTLARWCQPRLRPRLVYAYDPGSPILWLGLRGSLFSAPASNPSVSAFTVAWVASDPVARALTTTNVTINSGASGTATNNGTYRAWPVIQFWGPSTAAQLVWTSPPAGGIYFASGFVIPAGHNMTVDTAAQTVIEDGNPAASFYPYIDFANTRWAGLEPGASTLQLSGGGHVVVIWADSTI